MDRDHLELAYTKDKHASIRVVFQETRRLGRYQYAMDKSTDLFCTVLAMYVMDLDILCIDTKVFCDLPVRPQELRDEETFALRTLESHGFSSAVRRAVVLADELRSAMMDRAISKFARSFMPALNEH